MSPEAQRIAIAEACGWRDIKHTDHEDVDIESRSIIHWSGLTGVPPKFIHYENRIVIPDYLNDLNAMHEAEKVLLKGHEDDPDGCELWSDYQTYLILACPAYLSYHATAAQRAEAFLLTIGKWEASK